MNTSQISDNSFFDNLVERLDEIKKNDKVCIVGKDKLKGYIGVVTRIYRTQHDEIMYSVQLDVNGTNVERQRNNIKKHHLE
jgi:preprotein translocase subunit YajC